ncbi:MAG: multiprotein bridging factor aMBF1 [Candidatus Micrarchaeota archaeon]|nr:multiprotein bridging factor aMBF1 [Candidatus Micrarchaeota archaeon]
MDCEICGEGEAEYIILVEGARLQVCRECSGAGKILKAPAPQSHGKAYAKESSRQELEPVEGYGRIISEARKKLGLPLKVLAERINEKESFLERIEHEKAYPDEKVARKLEKELGVKLLQVAENESAASSQSISKGMTIGDIIEIERKKNK